MLMHFTYRPKYSFFVLPSNILGILNNLKGPWLDLLASYTSCLVFCVALLYRLWLETASQVAVIGRTWSDVIENITKIVVFIKFHELR